MWSVKGHRRSDLKVGKCMARSGDQANAWRTVEIKQTWLVESRRGDTLVGGVIGVETLPIYTHVVAHHPMWCLEMQAHIGLSGTTCV
ncbi:hypothetical protein Scep_025656 [Stephania cephalantha]|uniref:Uncharacterized protein n=1 Tax=Stephania cephalantha TaxID=152367 RepID=A0AAP0ENV7_9MAGN